MNGERTYKRAALPTLGAVLLLGAGPLAGCSKEGASITPQADRTLDPAVEQRIREKLDEMPGIGIYNRTMNKVIVFKHLADGSRSFNFVDPPSGGINFASSNGGQWTWSESEGLMILTEPSTGLGGGGGTVVAGNASLDIELAVCFSFDEEGLGMDLFSTGINDVAGVIGIAGDFDALINGDFSSGEDDLFDYFHDAHMQALEPSLFFALEVTRIAGPGFVTLSGGGYIASGSAGPDKQPLPVFPKGLQCIEAEGAGEVQTPLRVPANVKLALGDAVLFRHAKAGELAERFERVLLVEGDKIVERVPTYRGLGWTFF